jgi:hypothetical protein
VQGLIGGVFLPSGWGSNSGGFLTAGLNVSVYDSVGFKESFTFVDPDSDPPVQIIAASSFTTPLIVPVGFGAFGGHLFVSDQNNNIWQAAPATTELTRFRNFREACPMSQQDPSCPFWEFDPFGIEFTPPGWGSFGNQLLVSSGFEATADGVPLLDTDGHRYSGIVALTPEGGASVFVNIVLRDAQTDPDLQQSGLRQMLMLPDDFLVPSLGPGGLGKLLLVSVSGSGQGGGVLGELLALNSSGEIKGHLITGSVTIKFDPRGMILTNDGHVLISDTSDPIWIASPRDFAPGRGPACSVISSVATSSLWPPNHNLVKVGLGGSSGCPGATSVSVFSDEDDQADTGEGNFSPDARDIAPVSLRLRAERNGNGDGRVYLVLVEASDSLGNVAASCNTVVVPKSQSKKDQDAVNAQAAAAKAYCLAHSGTPPPGYFVIGVGPVIGPKQ